MGISLGKEIGKVNEEDLYFGFSYHPT